MSTWTDFEIDSAIREARATGRADSFTIDVMRSMQAELSRMRTALEEIKSKVAAAYRLNNRPYDQGRGDAFNECAAIAERALKP